MQQINGKYILCVSGEKNLAKSEVRRIDNYMVVISELPYTSIWGQRLCDSSVFIAMKDRNECVLDRKFQLLVR